jgi:hypothetical protein
LHTNFADTIASTRIDIYNIFAPFLKPSSQNCTTNLRGAGAAVWHLRVLVLTSTLLESFGARPQQHDPAINLLDVERMLISVEDGPK